MFIFVCVLWIGAKALGTSWAHDSIGEIKDTACAMETPTDKVTYPQMAGGHQYHIMYGMFLTPLMRRAHGRPAKLLEMLYTRTTEADEIITQAKVELCKPLG